MSSEVSEARRNVRTPRVYSVRQSFKTWLWQFVQYADLVCTKPSDHRAYLFKILDQPAFKAVELLKPPELFSFDQCTAQLLKRFDSGKTRVDYKLQLCARCQKPNKDFEGLAESLSELAEDAYPETAYPIKMGPELARDQFIQGVIVSNDIREKLFISQLGSLVEAVRVARQ